MRKKKKAAQFRVVPVSDLTKHQTFCAICQHPQRESIEHEYAETREAIARIAKEYRLNRRSVYRHARFTGLLEKRMQNLHAALDQIIEKGLSERRVRPVVVQAIAVKARINARGQWVSRSETVNLNELFEKMTPEEVSAYAERGELPDWFRQVIGDTGEPGEENSGPLN